MPETALAAPDGGPDAGAGAPPRPRSFLAFDPGIQRIGVASGNTLVGAGTPLRTLRAEGAFDAIGRLVAEWRPDALVVGVPRHPDGAPHDNTRRAERFARQLHGRFGLPVHAVDERYTTTAARADGARDLDAAAAALILSQFLSQQALAAAALSAAPPAPSRAADAAA